MAFTVPAVAALQSTAPLQANPNPRHARESASADAGEVLEGGTHEGGGKWGGGIIYQSQKMGSVGSRLAHAEADLDHGGVMGPANWV